MLRRGVARESKSVRLTVHRSLRLLSKRDRRVYVLFVFVQMTTSFLDLAGVLLLGLVAIMATATSQGNDFPAIVDTAAAAVGLGSLEQATLIGVVGGIAAILLIAKSLVNLFLVRRTFRFLAGRTAIVSANLSSRFFASSLLDVQSRPSQDVAYALGRGADSAVLSVLGSGMILAAEGALLGLLGLALLFIDPFVTIAAVVYFGFVAVFLQKPLSRWAGRLGGTLASAEIAATTIVQEGIGAYREVSVLDRRDFYRDSYRVQRIRSAGATGDMQFLALIPKNMMEIALVVGAVLLAFSQFLTRDAVAAVAILVVFLAAASRVMPSLLKIQAALATAHSSSTTAARTYQLAEDLASTQGSSRDVGAALAIRQRIDAGNPDFDPSIEVDAVSVTYPGSIDAALHNISVSLRGGQSLALVGSTGAGKSTLADIILGVLDTDQGTVLIGGEKPTDAILKWAGGIAYVPQEVALSHSTIRDNVALGLPREAIGDELVWDALRRARLADYLTGGREGLDTMVGERGVRLSGGQRQRLGVARALYTRPRLLVLDEATSALDAETEHAIAATLADLEGEVTTVTVAHRLATIRNADIVLYLENGRIGASGTFDEVRAAVPRFNHQAELLGL